MRNNSIYIFLIAFLIFQISCKEGSKKEIKTTTVAFKKEGTLQILQKDTDSILAHLDIEIADSDYFYMKNTQIPLDLIYLDEKRRIASFQKNAQPMNENSLSSKVPVKYVLEINAGLADKWSLAVGDSITYHKTP